MSLTASLVIGFGILAALCAFGAVLYTLLKSQQGQLSGGLKILQESFDSFERSQEVKNSTLRTELAAELANNRRELQVGLTTTTLALESKVGSLEGKVETRLTLMQEGVQTKLEQNLKEGFLQFEKVQTHLKNAELQLSNLNVVGQSINDLNSLLKLPHLRGSFGEATLERLLNDLLPAHCYELQYRIVPNSTERVDAVIKYPKFVLPVDSKFPREQVLPLFDSQSPEQLEQARRTLTDVMKGLAKQIREKYIHPEHGTADMALLFVPSETLYFEMLRNVKLCEELGKQKVFAVSPNTFAVTLQAIEISRSYYEMSKGVEKTIQEVKKAQAHFENFEKRFEEIGTSLTRAQNAFGMATTHLSRYSSAVSRLTGITEPEGLVPGESARLPEGTA